MHNINPLKTQLNPICHLLALLGAHHILHVSRIRVNLFELYDDARTCQRQIQRSTSVKNAITCTDANVTVPDTERHPSRYASNTEKHLVLI